MLATLMTCNTSIVSNKDHALDARPQLHDDHVLIAVRGVLLLTCYREGVIAEQHKIKLCKSPLQGCLALGSRLARSNGDLVTYVWILSYLWIAPAAWPEPAHFESRLTLFQYVMLYCYEG